MLQINPLQYLMQMLNYSLLVGAVTWVLLLVRGAQTLKDSVAHTVYEVNFGPLSLMAMSKQPAGDGFSVRFALESGLIWYVVFWLCIGGLCGLGLTFYMYRAARQ